MADHNFDIVSIGDTTQDVFIQIDDATVQCDLDRERCVMCLRYADKIAVEGIHDLTGGNASNNAIGSRRLGMRSAIYTVVGNDHVGGRIREEYDAEGVASNFIETDEKHGSNYSAVLNYKAERTILVFHEKREYHLPDIGAPDWVYLTSIGDGHEKLHEQLEQHLKRHEGVKLGFNPGTHQLKKGLEMLKPLMAVTDAFFVNKQEAELLVNGDHEATIPELLKLLKEHMRGIVVVTDGMAGSYAYNGKEIYFHEAFPLPAVERTGAGDAYGTAFVSALFHKKSFSEALTWGSFNAASVVQFIGPHEGLLQQKEIAILRKENPGFEPEPVSF